MRLKWNMWMIQKRCHISVSVYVHLKYFKCHNYHKLLFFALIFMCLLMEPELATLCQDNMSCIMRKPVNRGTDQLRGNRSNHAADQPICFHFLNPNFQASSNLVWLYSPVCVRPGQKPQRQVFSQQGSCVSRCVT